MDKETNVVENTSKVLCLGDVIKKEPLFADGKQIDKDEVKDKLFLFRKVAKLSNAKGDFYVFNGDLLGKDGIDGTPNVNFVCGGAVVMRKVRDIIRAIGMDAEILKGDPGVVVTLDNPIMFVLILVKAVGNDYWDLKDPKHLNEKK